MSCCTKPVCHYLPPNDAILSSGQVVITRIVSALRADWDRLDGQQQRALVSALEASTQATEGAEAFVWKHLDERLRLSLCDCPACPAQAESRRSRDQQVRT